MDWLNRTHVGDCRALLAQMAADGVKVQTCVTSPPYFGLRDYGHDGQIGLESSPAEYVAAMVDVFRAVREVLVDDGTVWLNLGDSYAATTKGSSGKGEKQITNAGTILADRRWRVPDGLKAKDLIGIPWRVAFALQQPYYSGRIKLEADRIWLAAMVDGEGCFYVHRRPAGQHAGDGYFRTQDSFSPAFEVANTHKSIVDRCMEIAGVGSVVCQEKDRRQPLWRWTVRANEARAIAREIYPYLVGKQQQCRIICAMPSNGERATASWEAMKQLHAGRETTVDFATPASMYEPGYYLRQDVIWSKPNPMPESVRDRCTKAHEYVFLLAKSERYYFDAEAIAERAKYPGDNRSLRADARKLLDPFCMDGGSRARTGNPTAESVNRRSVWTVTTKPFSGAHFATFPPELIQPCILAGAPAGGVVLDPFMGSGTTGQVATDLGRQFIGCELNPAYIELHDMRRTTIGMPL